MGLNLCTLSYDALYLYQVSKKIPQRVSELLSGCDLHAEIYKGTLFRRKCR